MTDYYRIPTLVLLSILVAVFASLYLQSRSPRRLLWLLGWCMAVLRIGIEITSAMRHPLGLAVGNASLTAAALMFLGSMSPLTFGKRFKIYFVVAYGAPLLLFSLLISFFPNPQFGMRFLILALSAATIGVALVWSRREQILPTWFTVPFVAAIGATVLYFTWLQDYNVVLYLAQSATNLITALLIVATYRRWSAGVVFSAMGFLIWTCPIVLHSLELHSIILITFSARAINLVKVMTAMGMIVLVLEDELATNEAAKQRDHRARVELERYSQLDVSMLLGRDPQSLYDLACSLITEASRFSQAILFFRGVEQTYFVAGKAGVEGALAGALESLGSRLSDDKLRAFGHSSSVSLELGNTFLVDLQPLFIPGDDLERLSFTRAHVIPIRSSSGHLEGSLLLSGVKNPTESLQADDLLPVELLVARIMAVRENSALLHRVMRAENLAGLGQLAGGVAHELNNPLTVVLGFAELMEETTDMNEAHRHASIIRGESLRMKQIIENLVRFWRPSPTERFPVAMDELLRDIERLRTPEFERLGISFRLTVSPDLPRVFANSDQMRQVFLHLLNNAVDAVEGCPEGVDREIRVVASCIRERLQVLVSDSGPGLPDPNRIFDPFFTTKPPGTRTGLGLSICYAIIREHGGEITAFNLKPRGAALAIEIPTRPVLHSDPVAGTVLA
jgi:two-component system NtrC family sensor kinase